MKIVGGFEKETLSNIATDKAMLFKFHIILNLDYKITSSISLEKVELSWGSSLKGT